MGLVSGQGFLPGLQPASCLLALSSQGLSSVWVSLPILFRDTSPLG